MQLDTTRKTIFSRRMLRFWPVLAVLAAAGVARADFLYTDGSFGISINLPDNTSVARVKKPAGESGTEIGQFTLPDGATVGRLVVSDLPADWTFDKAVEMVRTQLATDVGIPGEKITSEKPMVQGNHKGTLLLHAYDEAHRLHNAVLIVLGPDNQMFVLYIATRNTDPADGRKLVAKLAGGFMVLLQAKDDERVRTATAKGLQMLMDVVAPPPQEQDLWKEQYFLLMAGKEPYGYVVVRESLETRSKREGLALQTERWSFWPGGDGAEYERQTAFTSWDLHDDEWSSRIETVVAPRNQPARMVTSSHHTLRLGQSLLVETSDPTGKNKGKPINRIVPCPQIYLPQAWRWLLPRLLYEKGAQADMPGGWIALITYSPARHGLETQMFSRAVYGDSRQVLQREGLYGLTEAWQFGQDKSLARIASKDTALVATDKAEAERLFGPRITQWRAKVKASNSTIANQAGQTAAP